MFSRLVLIGKKTYFWKYIGEGQVIKDLVLKILIGEG